jgi:FlaG/FlaF family flagellin (archaellin)
MAGIQNESGVSVIIGTLLLILITVTAAAGLAIMVSQMQKDEMNRQSHLAAVKGEKIEILNIGLKNDPGAWNQSPFNVTENQSWNNWSSITLTLSNLNTDEVRVIGIAINDRYTRNYSTITDTPLSVPVPYNVSNHEYLTLPGTKSQKVRINFTDDFPDPRYIADGEQVTVKVITSMYNVFEKTFKPPNPVFLTKIITEDLGTIERRVIVLDGSASTADYAVVDWNWTVDSGAYTYPSPGNWTDTSNLMRTHSQGSVVRINPSDQGPFRIRLKVTDNIGMSRTSEPVDIPADQNYVPVANVNPVVIFSSVLNHDIVNVTLLDINGGPVPGKTVNFAIGSNPYNNLTFYPYYNVTDETGTATTSILNGTGTIKVIYGKFLFEVPVS